MKKHLLLGSALFAAISAFPQQAVQKVQAQPFNMASYLSKKFEKQLNPVEPKNTAQLATQENSPVYGPEMDPGTNSRSSASQISAPASWQPFTGSMNIYGMLVSNSKPLMYNDELRAVSFIHRKSPQYQPVPAPIPDAESGAIVGMVSDNWGNEWDTTLLWNDNSKWGRYPGGGIYNIPGSKCLTDSAYMVATGPITQVNTTLGWIGSYFASKQLDTLGGARNDNQVSPAFGSTLFAANSGALPYGKFDFPRYDFTITDDGKVRVAGIFANNINGTTNAAYGFKGASVVTGTFISGTFAWRSDSIQPDAYTSPSGSQYIIGVPHMAWNESGTVGYVWFIGVRDPRTANDSGSNMGYQPIVFKTTNSGASWSELPRIDFNDPSGKFNSVFKTILGVQGDSIGIPFFSNNEGQDGIVDRNDRLHIVSTVVGTFSKDPDSLGYTYILTHADQEQYRFGHRPGLRPYIWDFTETGNGWNVTLIDSMSSEAPGTAVGDDGYGDNPWDATGGSSGTDKVESDGRIQLSRTPDGRYIIYTWAESDTGLTFLSHKWNSIPNVKARMAEVGLETSTSTPAPLTVHPVEINITNPANTATPPYTINNNVKNKGVMHYVSPKAVVISNSAAAPNVAIGLPVTVSNNTFVPFKQLQPNTHWYLSANLNFGNVSTVDWPVNECSVAPKDTTKPVDTTVVAEILKNINNSKLFPNPANGSAQLSLNLVANSEIAVNVINTMGQVVSTVRQKGTAGANVIDLNVSDLASGVYMVNIKVGDGTGTKRLLIQH